MKEIKRYSKNLRDILIAVPLLESMSLTLLYVLKKIILKNEYPYGYSPVQMYTGYCIMIIILLLLLYFPFSDYRHLVKNGLTTPKLWKKLYVTVIPVIGILAALGISLFVK